MNREQKKDLAKILISSGLFLAGIITDNTYILIAAWLAAGISTLIEAFFGIIHGQLLDENFLMTVASIGAVYCGQYTEAVAVMLFYTVGEFFEDYAVNSSRKSISDLMNITPDTAIRFKDGKEEEVFPEELELGDIVIVRPGEKIPVDGTVIEGFSSINTSALTGESVPRDTEPGQPVLSGTVNVSGLLKIKTDKKYEDSTVSKVLNMVENSASNKAPVEKFISRFAKYYTPAVVILAACVAVIPGIISGNFHHWVYVAAEFLVISCPCAIVISVPLSLFAGIGAASSAGILVKGSNYLEVLSLVDTIAFDKTGTITEGKFHMAKVRPEGGFTKEELVSLATAAEKFSDHPIAKSIVAGGASEYPDMIPHEVKDLKEIPGKGIEAKLDDKTLLCGNEKLLNDFGIKIKETEASEGTSVHVGYDGQYAGSITVSDTVRESTAPAIKALKKAGIENLVMLTGDRKEIAEKVADEMGITSVYAELLPGDKVDTFEKIMNKEDRKNKKTVFVGDGINDAPVLARADAGIAMGAYGSDAAIEAADIVIMTDSMDRLPVLFKISKKIMRICKENIFFALAVKFSVMLLAPFGLVNMWIAVFADVGVAVLAILNSLRALKIK